MRKKPNHNLHPAVTVGPVIYGPEPTVHGTAAHHPVPHEGMQVDAIRKRMIGYETILDNRIAQLAESLHDLGNQVGRRGRQDPLSDWDPAGAVEDVLNDVNWGIANLHISQLAVDLRRIETWRTMLVAATNGTEGFRAKD